MTSRMHLARHTYGLALVIGVALSMPVSAAVEAPAAEILTATADPLVELEEVWVRGKRLADRITDVEDEFFELYNKVNKTNRFDVQCGYMKLSRDSMIMVRTCVPQFLASYSASYHGYTRTYQIPSTFGSYSDYGGYSGYSGGSFGSYRSYGYTPPPDLLAMHYREDYAKNVINVIYDDPDLMAKARVLAGMYKEMELVQGRYKELRTITRKKPGRDVARQRKAARRGMDRTGG